MPQDISGLVLLLVVAILVGVGGLAGGYFIKGKRVLLDVNSAQLDAKRIVEDAHNKQRELLLEAKDDSLRIKNEHENEVREHRVELNRQERRLQQKEEALEHRLQQKEEALDRRLDSIERRDRALAQREQENTTLREDLDKLKLQRTAELDNLKRERMAELDNLKRERIAELERISVMSVEEAKQQLLQAIESETRVEANRLVREIEREVKEQAGERARRILTLAVQRCTAELVVEATVSVVPLPNEEMKGRIIGREGRNIRALESATGVDVIIDDTPDAVTLSAYDPVRREIARLALQRLIVDGRIHPARIEEVVQSAKAEIEKTIREEGETAALNAGVHGLNAELIKILGRLRFRTSYGQNVLYHSVEVAHLCAALASELGIDVTAARTAGLLHDIGKALSQEVEGPHALIGADLVRRYLRSTKISSAVGNHHGEMDEPQSLEALLVQIADAISGSRPGARRESVENYIKRLEALENVANSFQGVDKSYAIQAGREVRIIVKPEEVDDLSAMRLARDIVKKIEETLEYPGQIKVTVMRETRAVDFAR